MDTAADRRRAWRAVLWAIAAAAIVCGAMAAGQLTIGSRSGQWTYGVIRPFTVRVVTVGVLVAAIVGAALGVSRHAIDRSETTTVACWIAGAMLLQLLLRSLTPFGMNRMVVSTGANAFYQVTLAYPAATVLRDFDRVRFEWPLHARSNMPGKLLAMYALERVSTSPRTLAWLIVFVSNVGGVLLYLLVRDLLQDKRAALFALVLYLFVPGKLFFFPLLNTVTPTFVMAWLLLVFRWLRTQHTVDAALAGIALYALFVFEPLPVVLGLLPAAFAVNILLREGGWMRFARQAAVSAIAFAAVHALVDLMAGFNAPAAFRDLGGEAVAFNESAGRRYGIWVFQNLLDFGFAAGVCQSVLFLFVLARLRTRPGEPIGLITVALAAVLLMTDIAGVNRGETVRLWIFLACLVQIPAAWLCAQFEDQRAISLVVAVTVVQVALGTATIGFVVP
jgi:methylthioxylose transferase